MCGPVWGWRLNRIGEIEIECSKEVCYCSRGEGGLCEGGEHSDGMVCWMVREVGW